MLSLLLELKSQNKKIVGISAPGRSTTVLNYCNITSEILDYVTEKSNLKIGKYTPGTHIEVVDDEIKNTRATDSVVYVIKMIAKNMP